ncbi:swi5-dependent recombination DNA repair protein 1 homolog [Hydractinia symbiolongicarpus]|uniref:swi5-dependent recombination DNA repair protein 1 homolog n=1 Tax=Hydractinia symbiolongicarpus TaxID=13093 RepID=UPI002549F380|nr:swi5-dependent recombination DNA repair protein 1 homolog [Hydractinia symbiolongicarpus]XP_057307413.1 swi5-dependent recombination DNA repair protein 1 homolog [Hydractinia symbiolongicarpus]
MTGMTASTIDESEMLHNKIEKNLVNTISVKDQLNLLKAEKKKLRSILEAREEELRKLNLVKTYRAKNNVKDLEALTRRWRETAQEAVQVLYKTLASVAKPEMGEFLNTLQIDEKLIRYDAESDDFY